jgi:heme-degrading monooxygenase HmoA
VHISEWDSLEQAQAWQNSEARKNLAPQRDKTIKIIRQYIVESAN